MRLHKSTTKTASDMAIAAGCRARCHHDPISPSSTFSVPLLRSFCTISFHTVFLRVICAFQTWQVCKLAPAEIARAQSLPVFCIIETCVSNRSCRHKRSAPFKLHSLAETALEIYQSHLIVPIAAHDGIQCLQLPQRPLQTQIALSFQQ